MFKLSKRSLNRLTGVHPVLIAIFVEAIATSPYDYGIAEHGGFRTASEQRLLYDQKLSQRDGYYKKSYHQSGLAIDIFGYVDGKATWDKDILEAIAIHLKKVALRYGVTLIWGGDWDNDGIRVDKDGNESFFDGAHFQTKLNQVT